MSYQTARLAIQAHVAANWTATPVAYDNDDFTPPDRAYWSRLTVLNNGGGGRSIGKPIRLYRFDGIVLFQIFAPERKGTHTLEGHIDTAVAMFEATKLSGGVVFEDVFGVERGADPDGPWFRKDVLADFRFDVLR